MATSCPFTLEWSPEKSKPGFHYAHVDSVLGGGRIVCLWMNIERPRSFRLRPGERDVNLWVIYLFIYFLECIFHVLFSPVSSIFERMTRNDFHPLTLACCPSFMKVISEKAEALQPAPQRQLGDPFAFSHGASNRAGRVLGTHLARVSFNIGFSQLCPGAGEGLHLITCWQRKAWLSENGYLSH